MKNIPSKFALLILLLTVLGAANVFAQENKCALKLEVSNFDGSGAIKNAQATAVSVATKRVYRSALQDGLPYFAELPEGSYDITVTKTGFKQTKDSSVVWCARAEEGVLSQSLLMQKGSSKQIYTVPKVKIGSANINPVASSAENNSSGGQGMLVGEERPPDALPRARVGQKLISKGVINGSAINLPKPEYPPAAKAVRASGTIQIQVTIDEQGNVISAEAVNGHPLLHAAAVKAAQQAKFKPTLLLGKPVKVVGIIIYNFVAN